MINTNTIASQASVFLNSIGINTHIDFTNSSYGNLSTVESAINYLGVKNLRDSANSSSDVGSNGLWQQVANATGAKFDAFLGEGSVGTMVSGLAHAVSLADQGILNAIEGGNEEDQGYALSLGNNLGLTAAYQATVAATAHALGLPAINMSFGTGWSRATGDYGMVGNLADVADYGNAHTYFGTGNTPLSTIQTLNADANMAAQDKPVITTEMGWYTTHSSSDSANVSPTVQAKYMLDGLMDAFQAGDARTYLYELLDQHANSSNTEYNFGLFNADGTPKLAATALHNLTTLLSDNGGSFTPDGLSYQLTGMQSTDHSMLLEKSDGTFWMAIWNETRLSGPKAPVDISVPDHTVTLNLASPAGSVTVYDPLTGTSAVQSSSNTSSVQISVPDHPILVEISSNASVTPVADAPAANAGQDNAIRLLYEGALGRAPSGLEQNYWANELAVMSPADQSQGLVHTLAQMSGGFNGSMSIADGFLNSGEFKSLYGGLDNHAFVNQIYENALNRPADAAGAQYWDHLLDTGAATKAMVLVAIADSGEASQVHANLLLTV